MPDDKKIAASRLQIYTTRWRRARMRTTNSVRLHKSLSVTPAMAVGVSDRLWTFKKLMGLHPVARRNAMAAGKDWACLFLAWTLLGAGASVAGPVQSTKFLRAAAALENRGVTPDHGYHHIAYPLGDVPANTGVCADVVVRAYRGIGIDLQRLVHEDMVRDFSAYPRLWGLHRPDPNVDHRRVLNLAAFFHRHGKVLPISNDPRDYRPGDLVTWNLNPRASTPHIGIVMPARSADGRRPLILHNSGSGQIVQDILFSYRITGHFRYAID